MKRTKGGGPITEAHRRRWRTLQDYGCLACRQRGYLGVPGDVHHLLSGGYRISQDATIVLCPWHHRGLMEEGWTVEGMERIAGPSLFHSKRRFIEEFGTEADLLELSDALTTSVGGTA